MKSEASNIFVIPRRSLPSLGTIFLTSFFNGLITLVFAVFLIFILFSPAMSVKVSSVTAFVAIGPVALIWPIWRLRHRYKTIVTTARAAWLGFGYGMGIFGLPCGLAGMILLTDNNPGAELWIAVGVQLLLIAATTVVITVAWFIVRLTLPKFVLQDGTLCFECGYCLIGTTSMRCSECGWEFTYDALETTEEAFLARMGPPMARPTTKFISAD